MATRLAKTVAAKPLPFDVRSFLDSAGIARKIVEFRKKEVIFSQGEPAATVVYVQQGSVRITVVNKSGKEAVVAMFGSGDFLGEGCLAGQSIRIETATAIVPTTTLVIKKNEMIRILHEERALADRFISFMLSRNIRVEADLVDQLCNSTEKRLARTLLLLSRYGQPEQPQKMPPRISQEMLAEMIGTSRSRVNFFMNKFKKLGFIKYDRGLQVNNSLLSVVLHE